MSTKESLKHITTELRRTPLSLAFAAAMMSGAAFSGHAADGSQLEEVIVTAQKRAENLQAIPISVQSINAATLEKNHIVSLSDVGASVPGLNIQPYPGENDTLFLSIRGIEPNQNLISASIPMAIQINGVPTTSLTGLNTAGADLERIEVLKGPQGVLSGRNATGGTVNIYTAKPDLGELWFKQQVTVAQRGEYLSKTVLNVPVTDSLAAKIAYVKSGRDDEGVKNSAPGGYQFGKLENETWRIDLRWKPSSQVTVDYGYDNGKTESLPTPWQCTHAFPAFAASMPACSTNFQPTLYAPYSLPKSVNKAEGHTLNIEWVASPVFTMRSITGYRKVDARNDLDFFGMNVSSRWASGTIPLTIVGAATPFNGSIKQNPMDTSAWSQEFQFLGDISKNLKYTAGIFVAEDKGTQFHGPYISSYMPGIIPLGGGVFADYVNTSNFGETVKNTSKAIFGQLTWTPDILEQKLDIVPGIRFTRDTRQATAYNFSGATYALLPTANPMVANFLFPISAGINAPSMMGNASYSNTSPAVSFNYHFSRDVMGYAKYATAYTAGGFDPDAADQATFTKGFEPEKAKSVELGMKGEFLNRRLRTNLAVFKTKFTNEQRTVPVFSVPANTTVWMMMNAGGSDYSGLELNMAAAVTENLRLSFDASTVQHNYSSFVVNGVDHTNDTNVIVPKLSYAASVDYRFPNIGLPGRLEGTLSVAHKDSTSAAYTTSLQVANLGSFDPSWMTTPAYTVWNGRLALSQIKAGPSEKGDVTVALWVKNLTDKKYMTFNSIVPIAFSSPWGQPRTVGLDLIYRYN